MEPPKIAPSEIISRARKIQFLTVGVPPSYPVYVTEEDNLSFDIENPVVVGATAEIRWRTLRADGQIIGAARDIPLTQTSHFFTFPLTEGFLVAVSFRVIGGVAAAPGAHYVRCVILRHGATVTNATEVLINGYSASNHFAGWPGGLIRFPQDGPGRIRTLTGTNPIAGVEISETVPNGVRWELHSVQFSLVTDATVATRGVGIIIDDGITEILRMVQTQNQTATQTVRYMARHMGQIVNIAADTCQFAAPFPLKLAPTWRIRTLTQALQAGDDFGAPQLHVIEWVEN